VTRAPGPESSPLDTVVTWTLTPTPSGGTKLALEHSGFLPANASLATARAKGGKRGFSGLGEVLAQS